MAVEIIDLRLRPEYAEAAAAYFSSEWSILREVYAVSIADSITTAGPLPRWFLMMEGGAIIGSFGLIQSDFTGRTDLFPWLCALYVAEPCRCRGLGGELLAHCKALAAQPGFPMLYLATDHIGYYERYGFERIGVGTHTDGDTSRIYTAKTGN